MSSGGETFFASMACLMVVGGIIIFLLGGAGGRVGRSERFAGTEPGESLERMERQYSGWAVWFIILAAAAVGILWAYSS